MSEKQEISGLGKIGSPMLFIGLAVLCAVIFGGWWFVEGRSSGFDEPEVAGGAPTVRRLSENQYRNSIQYIFGDDIDVLGRFDPPVRVDGLLAIGDSSAVITPSGIERNLARAHRVASQVLSEEKRDRFLTCHLPIASEFNESCARDFLNTYGSQLMRRPLVDDELNLSLKISQEATEKVGDFYKGLEHGLVAYLISPAFMYRIETSEEDPEKPGSLRLDRYSLASRISFLLWDAPPDQELLGVAESGDIYSPQVLEEQIDRMMASPRFEEGMRAFFEDNFGYDRFEGLSKDASIFPLFSPQLRDDAREQSIRTIIHHLIVEHGDYRELFTTQKSFINRNLGALFRVPVNVGGHGSWTDYEFGPDSNRAGILTLPGFLMLDASHEGRSSPTIRGKTVRELFLCQIVPPPPGDVNFDIVEDTSSPMRTARERLVRHNEDPVCSGCHEVTDPIGLAYENYDAIGQFRTHENSALIDPSGNFEGVPFDNAIDLQVALIANRELTKCIAKRTYEYGVGRSVQSGEFEWMDYIHQKFSDNGYRFTDLLKLVVTSKAFQAVERTASL